MTQANLKINDETVSVLIPDTNLNLKNDLVLLEFPFFSISKNPDTKIFRWASACGRKTIEIHPSSRGRATMDDIRILVFVMSNLVDMANRGHECQRTMRFKVGDYLDFLGRKNKGGKDTNEVEKALDRLVGTRVKTNVWRSSTRTSENFGFCEYWKIVEKNNQYNAAVVDVKISEFTFSAIESFRVLTLDKSYPQLPPFSRRIYEIGRKHCGRQRFWKIDIELLRRKSGSNASIYDFRRQLSKIEKKPGLGEYCLRIDGSDVVFGKKEG